MNAMKCPHCETTLRKVPVRVFGVRTNALSYQCKTCDYFEFDGPSTKQVVNELQESPLKIRQKIVKLSADRLGIYFNRNVVESLGLKSGEDIQLSVPDKKHILLELDS